MSETLSNLRAHLVSPPVQTIEKIRPEFYRISRHSEREAFRNLLTDKPFIQVSDQILPQLKELVKITSPSQKFTEETLQKAAMEHLDGSRAEDYGVWVYYPWNEKMVHLLDEKEFLALRTNRNLYKITPEERDSLSTKKIGIIGLSVGQSVAMTLAMERSFGELRIADFDTLDLSNMNRIRTGVHNLGVPKTVIVAREITEIDPFLKVTCFHEGINEKNIDEFIHQNGRLDLLIDECDSLDIKILCRLKARSYGVPVLMDTSDRGMIDIERFDLENNREIFHGLLGKIAQDELKNLTNEQKIPYVLKIIDAKGLPLRSKVSLIEIGQSISTWPQLSSAVAMGGAVTADTSRRVLTDQFHSSGRFYIDPEKIISDHQKADQEKHTIPNPYSPLSIEDMKKVCSESSFFLNVKKEYVSPSNEIIERIVLSAGKAPSSGNDQPWKWMYLGGILYLFHDIFRSFSFGDYRNIGSYESLGAAIENLVLSAHQEKFELSVQLFPLKRHPLLIAAIQFLALPLPMGESHVTDELFGFIDFRHTNRKITQRTQLDPKIYTELNKVAGTMEGASLTFIKDQEKLQLLGEIIAAIDRIRILHPHGHYDFFHREMRWTQEDVLSKRDGMDIETLHIPKSALGALRMVSEAEVINMIREIDGGQMFKSVSKQSVITASAMGLITMNSFSPESYINGGRALQRLWLKATQLNIALQPLIAPLYLFPRILFGNGEGLPENMKKELYALREQFEKLFCFTKKRNEIFLFKIFKAEPEEVRSLRLPLKDILTFG